MQRVIAKPTGNEDDKETLKIHKVIEGGISFQTLYLNVLNIVITKYF